MPVSISPDLPNPDPEGVRIPSAAWDELIGAAWDLGWGSEDDPRGIEAGSLDPAETRDLIRCYERVCDESYDSRDCPPEWAQDLPHPDELRDLVDGWGMTITPCA